MGFFSITTKVQDPASASYTLPLWCTGPCHSKPSLSRKSDILPFAGALFSLLAPVRGSTDAYL